MISGAPRPVSIGRIRRKIVSAILEISDVHINHSKLPRGTKISAPISLGYHNRINGKALIKGSAPVRIGNFNAFGADIRIISSNHPRNMLCNQQALVTRLGLKRTLPQSTGVRIGSDTWVGDETIILPGVSIGDGVIIGAGSVVTRDVIPFSVVAGVPARTVKMRFRQDIIDLLRKIEWWELDLNSLEKIKDIFKYESEDELVKHLQRAHKNLAQRV